MRVTTRIADDPPLLTRVHLLARPQEDCVSLDQLRDDGITDGEVESLVKRGALTRVTRGVFIVGPPPMSHAQLRWAAVLTTASRDPALSYKSAAEIRGVLRETTGIVWVTIRGQLRRRFVETLVDVGETGRPGRIVIMSTRRPVKPDYVDRLPVTSSARTIVDVAAMHGLALAEIAYKESDFRGLLKVRHVLAEIGRGIAGSAIVRRLVASIAIVGPTGTETPEEQLLLEAMREVGVPEPQVQFRIRANGQRYRLDFAWIERRASVEALGGIHKKGYRKRADAIRTANLASIGIRERCVENDDIVADPIAQALGVLHWLEQLPPPEENP